MSILQQIVLRHRAEGYVRFSLPASLCDGDRVRRIEWALKQHAAVSSARIYAGARKLAIRYVEGIADLRAIAALLKDIVLGVDAIVVPSACCTASVGTGLVSGPDGSGVDGLSRWLRAKYQEIGETLTALGIVIRNTFGWKSQKGFLKHSDLTDFLTDILVLYLIRAHWHAITELWLKRPWLYRYEWMATIYMIFLLMRSKLPKN
ncbi:cation transporter [Candidatus Methylospira mobilis]|uniref:Cation transporter n=1 Tax=Candidatus Methylospira mobilis TaxID=1808979 RepID=A0A5Q0BIS9_9GAMM|nr:cation transporter [Candidatus Methylospira mobilis]QFY43723.1 cation transporter [Candidatus Methylospira mobilis]WNV04709.1 cation transporter [Candidatus Methylospira mobilis]